MDVIEAIRTRRSVRRYKRQPVPKDIILELLEFANLAPSASNRQPWEFIIVERLYLDQLSRVLDEAFLKRSRMVSEKVMKEIVRDLPIPTEGDANKLEGIRTFYRTLGGASVAVVVLVPKEKDPWTQKNNLSDASAAIENLLLAAWDRNLGSCWLTGPLTTMSKEIAAFLDVPDDREIVALVSLGYPDHQPEMPPKKDISKKVKWLGFD